MNSVTSMILSPAVAAAHADAPQQRGRLQITGIIAMLFVSCASGIRQIRMVYF